MATGMQQGTHMTGIDALRRGWGWYLALGIVQIVLGAIAVALSALTTLVSVSILGWLLIIGGVLAFVHGFSQKQWSGFFINLVVGALYAVTGFIFVTSPIQAAAALTLLIAILLIIGGIFRIGVGIAGHFHHRGWLLLNGIITLVLGVLIWRQWPSSSLWVIGLFVGIEMIFYGWSLVMLSLAAKNLPSAQQ